MIHCSWRPKRPRMVHIFLSVVGFSFFQFQSLRFLASRPSSQGSQIIEPASSKPTRAVESRSGNLTFAMGPIFYNLFVDSTKLPFTKEVVREQLRQRDISAANDTLLYSLVGHKAFQEYMTKNCEGDCHLRQYLEKGDEADTLDALWQYCHSAQTDSVSGSNDLLVTYIHDKDANNKARRMATKASLDCRKVLREASNPRMCNICAGAFHIFPQFLASANMWTARCSYIRRLHPPRDYARRIQEMFDNTLNHTILKNSGDYACLRPHHEAPNFMGLGRYSYERWPFSHPHVKPCDVLPISEGDLPWDEFPHTWKPLLQKAPRTNAKNSGIQTGPYKSTWARLEGRLFEWKYLYNLTPPAGSWVWKWYRGYEHGAPGFLKRCNSTTEL